jgi:hypothetical protein
MNPAGECRDDEAEGDNLSKMVKVGSLEQLYTAADKRVLLSLALPLGASGLVDTPRLRYVITASGYAPLAHVI